MTSALIREGIHDDDNHDGDGCLSSLPQALKDILEGTATAAVEAGTKPEA